jgi:hypothetical protein
MMPNALPHAGKRIVVVCFFLFFSFLSSSSREAYAIVAGMFLLCSPRIDADCASLLTSLSTLSDRCLVLLFSLWHFHVTFIAFYGSSCTVHPAIRCLSGVYAAILFIRARSRKPSPSMHFSSKYSQSF